jgi:hypothetical protein
MRLFYGHLPRRHDERWGHVGQRQEEKVRLGAGKSDACHGLGAINRRLRPTRARAVCDLRLPKEAPMGDPGSETAGNLANVG